MRAILFVLGMLIASGLHLTIWACSCLPVETFCNEIDRAQANDLDQLVVVRGVITEEIFVNEYRTDRIFEIKESFINPKQLTSFRVKEGNGADCGRFLGDDYQVGDELVVVVYLWHDTTLITHFSECSPAPLRVRGNKVTGKITEQRDQTMTLSQFRKLESCFSNNIAVTIFPNPVTELLTIQKIRSEEGLSYLEIEVFDLLGRLVFRHTLDATEQRQPVFELSTQQWPEGSYLVALKNHNGQMTKPITVTHR